MSELIQRSLRYTTRRRNREEDDVRIGAPISSDAYSSPEEWVELVVQENYGAAYCPLEVGSPPEEIERYARAAADAGIVIAEVGAWAVNPLSSDPQEAEQAIAYSQKALELADRIGARCCVNIAGTTGPVWAGHSAENFAPRTFERIVESVQTIIDAVRPDRTFYTIEVMPWIAPQGADEYLMLLQAIDRDRCAVHFDPGNMVNDPHKYYITGELIKDFVARLGPQIRCCHAKDIRMDENFPPWTVRLWECVPGAGNLDWRTLLTELAKLDPDIPVMLEHLDSEEEYRAGVDVIRKVAEAEGIEFIPPGQSSASADARMKSVDASS
jgi:sugar phosphate isomerase/epimerase